MGNKGFCDDFYVIFLRKQINVITFKLSIKTISHKVHTFIEYHSVCPLVGIGTLPPPLSPASVPLPPEPKGGGHTRLETQYRRLEKKLSTLPTLWPLPMNIHWSN